MAHGDEVVAPLNDVIDEFLERGDPVYKSRDWHPPQTKHFQAYGGTWPVHCVQNTRGAEFHPQLKDDPRIRVISKGLGDTDCYSAFDETDLALGGDDAFQAGRGRGFRATGGAGRGVGSGRR